MAEEFIINSRTIEDKINQLLPSQGGFGAGIDFSASTMVIPIIDLTESAEGSGLRQDLQTSLSHTTASSFEVSNASTTIVNTTGYYRVFGTLFMDLSGSATLRCTFKINDGSSDKIVWGSRSGDSNGNDIITNYDFNVFLSAGDSLIADSDSADGTFVGSTRQIADILGNLTNP
jgi:hypothetical protein